MTPFSQLWITSIEKKKLVAISQQKYCFLRSASDRPLTDDRELVRLEAEDGVSCRHIADVLTQDDGGALLVVDAGLECEALARMRAEGSAHYAQDRCTACLGAPGGYCSACYLGKKRWELVAVGGKFQCVNTFYCLKYLVLFDII